MGFVEEDATGRSKKIGLAKDNVDLSTRFVNKMPKFSTKPRYHAMKNIQRYHSIFFFKNIHKPAKRRKTRRKIRSTGTRSDLRILRHILGKKFRTQFDLFYFKKKL